MKKRPKASDRIFYIAPRKWKIWKVFEWIATPAAIVIFCLTAFMTIALQYAP